jgi:hypothetical protein
MKIKATQPAFFNGSRVRVGQELDVPSGMKGSWFVRTEEYKAPAEKKAKAPSTLSEMAKAPVSSPDEAA